MFTGYGFPGFANIEGGGHYQFGKVLFYTLRAYAESTCGGFLLFSHCCAVTLGVFLNIFYWHSAASAFVNSPSSVDIWRTLLPSL
ncbi:hypothetical protein WKI13_15300 [Teredinibacter turnerae]|uniref:hypothetical protein n=1 Tax=Teredinibacter turnerae TaxID=2426 RepID=UPI0003666338|nr:hypothetical protein [Teredinibacter turnerae]